MISLYSKLARQRYEAERKKNEEDLERNNMLRLSEWLEFQIDDPTIFVDQDETLLHLGYKSEISNLKNKNSFFIDDLGIVVRPNAYTFLKECRKIAKVYILTAGITNFQRKILEKVNLINVVEGVYGLDQFHNVPQKKKATLIDNLPYNHPNSAAKLEAMGGGMFFKVPDWYGTKSDDNALMELLPKIKQVYV